MYTDPAPDVHPLTATLSRISSVNENYYADMGRLETGWFPAADLLEPDSAVLKQALERQASHYPTMKNRTRGSYFIGEYSWYVPAIAVGAFLAEKRVPDFSLENLALRFGTYTWRYGDESGEAKRIEARFLSGRFAALPDDPAANHPDALVLPDANALREWLRTALETHLTPLIERIYTETRLGRHAQWCLVADNSAALFLAAGEAMNDEAQGKAEGLLFVKADGSPMRNPGTGYFTIEYQGHCETYRARGGCCLYYTTSDEAEYCSTCVLRKPEERDQIMLGYMAERYSKIKP